MHDWWYVLLIPVAMYGMIASPATIDRHLKMLWKKLRSK